MQDGKIPWLRFEIIVWSYNPGIQEAIGKPENGKWGDMKYTHPYVRLLDIKDLSD